MGNDMLWCELSGGGTKCSELPEVRTVKLSDGGKVSVVTCEHHLETLVGKKEASDEHV